MRAWSLYTHTEENPYAGHGGYDDALGRHYSYDSQVANHRGVSVGDLVIVRGPEMSLGVGFIARLDQTAGTKSHRRCPTCETSQLERRKTLRPTFRCTRGHTFDQPLETDDPVTQYLADFELGYVEFTGFSCETLEKLSLARSKQNAIRELELDATLAILREHRIFTGLVLVE